jgi:translation initiation factor 3 subunit D
VILGTQTSKPKDLAGQMSLNPDHCWGIVRALVDMLLKQPEGESAGLRGVVVQWG